MIDATNNSVELHYASIEARLGDIVRDSGRHTVAAASIYLVYAGALAMGLTLNAPTALLDHLPAVPAIVTLGAVGASLGLTAYLLLLEFRARRREIKARVLLIDGELLQARITAMRSMPG